MTPACFAAPASALRLESTSFFIPLYGTCTAVGASASPVYTFVAFIHRTTNYGMA